MAGLAVAARSLRLELVADFPKDLYGACGERRRGGLSPAPAGHTDFPGARVNRADLGCRRQR